MDKGLHYAIADFENLWAAACDFPEGVGRGNYIFFELWRNAFYLLPTRVRESLPEFDYEFEVTGEELYFAPYDPTLLIKGPAPDRKHIFAEDEPTHLTECDESIVFDCRTAFKHVVEAVAKFK